MHQRDNILLKFNKTFCAVNRYFLLNSNPNGAIFLITKFELSSNRCFEFLYKMRETQKL